jgi:hypothetical protein
VLNEILGPLNCRGGFVTFVATKVTKKACQQKGFFAARGFCPANQAKPRAAKHLPYFVRAKLMLRKHCYAPPRALPTIVLPDFARSCSADLENNISVSKMSGGMSYRRAGCMAGMTV